MPDAAIHVSTEPLTAFTPCPVSDQYEPSQVGGKRRGDKPRGLWYGVGSAWVDWMVSERWWPSPPRFVSVATRPARILRINNLDAFDNFCSNYGSGQNAWLACDLNKGIHWRRIALEYDGIEIAPYLDDRRLDYACAWYYTWDCASGCIWRGDVTVETLGEVDVDADGKPRGLSKPVWEYDAQDDDIKRST